MSDVQQDNRELLARRYSLSKNKEWQKVVAHFELSDRFALIVLLVADADGEAICRTHLTEHLKREGKQLIAVEMDSPADLRRLPSDLFNLQLPDNVACLWLGAVAPDYAKNYSEWREAWQFALARINSHRNSIRDTFRFAVLFAGAPWLQQVMREIAPDLWSVRTLVSKIEPKIQTSNRILTESANLDQEEEETSGDPLFAIQEAEKLRGVPGKELALSRLLHRAGNGFAADNNFNAAFKAYADALDLKQSAASSESSILSTLSQLAWICQMLNEPRRSLIYVQQGLDIARKLNDRKKEGILNRRFGTALLDLGDIEKAILHLENALAIAREIGDKHGQVAALGNLGIAFRLSGNARKAIALYEECLSLHQELGDRLEECNTLSNLGNAYADINDTRKAIEYYERALAISRDNHDVRREGAILGNLGAAYADLGDNFKAIELFDSRLTIARKLGDRRGEGNALWNSADSLRQIGKQQEAISRAEGAFIIFQSLEDPNASMVREKLAEWRKV